MNREGNHFGDAKINRSSHELFRYGGMPTGGRGLEEYEKKMMFSRNELEGKRVLDLGAGPKAKFAQELADSGVSAEVISLSPHFAGKEFAQVAQENAEGSTLIAGKGEELPFREESFDVVLCFHVDEHIGRESFFKIFIEMSRVLKPGGFAKYGPVYDVPGEWYPGRELLSNESLMKEMEVQRVNIEIEEVPESIIPKQKMKDGYANAFWVPAQYIILRKNKVESAI